MIGMWGKSWKELERRVKDVEVLLKEFTDAMVLDGRKLYGRLNKLENKVDTLGLKDRRITTVEERRIATLEQQVNDLMNREEEWKRRLAKIETGMIVDQMKFDGVWKEEEEDWTLLPRLGDLVVNIGNGNDIRRVFENHYGFMFVGKEYRTVYARNQLKDSLKEWKVIARKVDLK